MTPGAPPPPELPRFEATGDGRYSVHGTAVALDAGTGLLILGPAGAGKSGLAAGLIALGARLVADDLVLVEPGPGAPRLQPPAGRPAAIELRGLGIVTLSAVPSAPLRAMLLLAPSSARLPEPEILAMPFGPVPLLRHPPHPDLAAKLLLYLGASHDRDAPAPNPLAVGGAH